jgi:TPP-dependent pyruvate/acetoin dehydrogenase alpha subunit
MTGQPEIKSFVDMDKNKQLFYQMKLIRRFEEKSAALYTKERSVDFFICM